MNPYQFKIKYNYATSEIYEDNDHWLTGCIIIEADTYLDAQKKFKKEYPGKAIEEIEIVYEN